MSGSFGSVANSASSGLVFLLRSGSRILRGIDAKNPMGSGFLVVPFRVVLECNGSCGTMAFF